jgi:hypothetical protein
MRVKGEKTSVKQALYYVIRFHEECRSGSLLYRIPIPLYQVVYLAYHFRIGAMGVSEHIITPSDRDLRPSAMIQRNDRTVDLVVKHSPSRRSKCIGMQGFLGLVNSLCVVDRHRSGFKTRDRCTFLRYIT